MNFAGQKCRILCWFLRVIHDSSKKKRISDKSGIVNPNAFAFVVQFPNFIQLGLSLK